MAETYRRWPHESGDNYLDAPGDALHAVLCAAGYNLQWLLRAIVRLGLKALLLRPLFLVLVTAILRASRRPTPFGTPQLPLSVMRGA
jgi:hypothetical protein